MSYDPPAPPEATMPDAEFLALLEAACPPPSEAEIAGWEADAEPLDEVFRERCETAVLALLKQSPATPAPVPPLPAPRLNIVLHCTYCHAALTRSDAGYCASCLAPHHQDCFRDHGQCSTLGCGETEMVLRQVAPSRRRRRLPWILGSGLAAFVGVAALQAPESRVTPGIPQPLPQPTPERWVVVTSEDAVFAAGRVVDPRGRPVPAARVSAVLRSEDGREHVTLSTCDAAGQFVILGLPEDAPQGFAHTGELRVVHPELPIHVSATVTRLDPAQRRNLILVLKERRRVEGTLLDAAGQPAANVLLEAYGPEQPQRWTVRTDAKGRFLLEQVTESVIFRAYAPERGQKLREQHVLAGDRQGLVLRLRQLPAGQVITHTILGMQLAEVTPELQARFDLDHPRGVVILDPGPHAKRFGVGELRAGDHFWIVGGVRTGGRGHEAEVAGLRDLVVKLLGEIDEAKGAPCSVRVVFCQRRDEHEGTNTQHMRLSRTDQAELLRRVAGLRIREPIPPRKVRWLHDADRTLVRTRDGLSISSIRPERAGDRAWSKDLTIVDLTQGGEQGYVVEGWWRLGSAEEAWFSLWAPGGAGGVVLPRGEGNFRFLLPGSRTGSHEISFRPTEPANAPRTLTFSRLGFSVLDWTW